MRTVKIGELKAKLSAHLEFVRNGEEILVCDRDKPIARIIPCDLEDYSEQEQRLIAQGILLPAKKPWLGVGSLPEPVGTVPDEVVERILREERDGR